MKTTYLIFATIFVMLNMVSNLTTVLGKKEKAPKIAENAPQRDAEKRYAKPKASPAKSKSSNEIEKTGYQKLQQIQQLEEISSSSVIKFSVSDYQRLVTKNPRPYDVVMLFNVKQHCKHCDQVEVEFNSMVYSFIQTRGRDASTTGKQKEKQIFFGVLYFNDQKEVQQMYRDQGMTTVPYIAVSAQNLKREDKVELFFGEQDKWLVSASEVFDAQKQIDFVNNQLRTDVKLTVTYFKIARDNLIILFIMGCLFNLVKYAYTFLCNQWVWFSIAIGVYVICTGGLVYSMLNNMPWFKFERNQYGSISIVEYFMRGQRGQWAGEGYLISVLVTVIGLGYLYLVKIQDNIVEKSQMRIAVMISLASLFMLQNLLVMAYRIKSPWYNPSFMPPNYYQTGTLLQDQGNNI